MEIETNTCKLQTNKITVTSSSHLPPRADCTATHACEDADTGRFILVSCCQHHYTGECRSSNSSRRFIRRTKRSGSQHRPAKKHSTALVRRQLEITACQCSDSYLLPTPHHKTCRALLPGTRFRSHDANTTTPRPYYCIV